MLRIFLAAFAALIGATQAPAFAQVTVLEGKYTEENIIRVVSRVKMPAPPATAYKVAMLKVATMAGQRGFSRFAVVKVDDCVTLGINNSLPIVQTCKIFAKMITDGEIAEPKGRDPVKYTLYKRLTTVFTPQLTRIDLLICLDDQDHETDFRLIG